MLLGKVEFADFRWNLIRSTTGKPFRPLPLWLVWTLGCPGAPGSRISSIYHAGIRPRGCRTPTRGRKFFRGVDVSRNV